MERSTSEKQLALGVEFSDDLGKLTFLVLDLVGLVNNDVVELYLLQVAEADSDPFEGSHDNIEFSSRYALFYNILPFFFGGDQLDNPTAGHPFPELILPISQCDFRGNDNMRAFDFLKFLNKRYNGYSLDCFSKTHIVGENAVDSAFVEGDEPVQAHKLIELEVSAFEDGGLFGESGESFLLVLLFLDNVHDFRLFFVEMASTL